jgi:antirestriction protein ArdC
VTSGIHGHAGDLAEIHSRWKVGIVRHGCERDFGHALLSESEPGKRKKRKQISFHIFSREDAISPAARLESACNGVSLETGLPHDPAQHTAYIASWLEALKKDKNEIFRAASAASKATDYVLGKDRAVTAPGGDADHATENPEQSVRAR